MAVAVINSLRGQAGQPDVTLNQAVAQGLIDYMPMPQALHGKYQCYTQADLVRLRATGCEHVFADVAQGVSTYVKWLNKSC